MSGVPGIVRWRSTRASEFHWAIGATRETSRPTSDRNGSSSDEANNAATKSINADSYALSGSVHEVRSFASRTALSMYCRNRSSAVVRHGLSGTSSARRPARGKSSAFGSGTTRPRTMLRWRRLSLRQRATDRCHSFGNSDRAVMRARVSPLRFASCVAVATSERGRWRA